MILGHLFVDGGPGATLQLAKEVLGDDAAVDLQPSRPDLSEIC